MKANLSDFSERAIALAGGPDAILARIAAAQAIPRTDPTNRRYYNRNFTRAKPGSAPFAAIARAATGEPFTRLEFNNSSATRTLLGQMFNCGLLTRDLIGDAGTLSIYRGTPAAKALWQKLSTPSAHES